VGSRNVVECLCIWNWKEPVTDKVGGKRSGNPWPKIEKEKEKKKKLNQM
jgi:hypothetical protein